MYYVYVLKDSNNRLYIGYSANLKQRISDHAQQKVYTTKRMNEPRLFYYEAFDNENQAKKRERKLKQFGSSYTGLMKRLERK